MEAGKEADDGEAEGGKTGPVEADTEEERGIVGEEEEGLPCEEARRRRAAEAVRWEGKAGRREVAAAA